MASNEDCGAHVRVPKTARLKVSERPIKRCSPAAWLQIFTLSLPLSLPRDAAVSKHSACASGNCCWTSSSASAFVWASSPTVPIQSLKGRADAPIKVTCPSTPLLRDTGSPLDGTQKVDPSEQSYTVTRRQNVLQGLWTRYLADSTTGDAGYNFSFSNTSTIPRVAIASSGGGYRSALSSAGLLSALDSRNASNVGPFLQLADYIAGLSGGSWITTSLTINDLPTLPDLVLGSATRSGWLLEYDLLSPAQGLAVQDDALYYADIESDVSQKVQAGFATSIVDLWSVLTIELTSR